MILTRNRIVVRITVFIFCYLLGCDDVKPHGLPVAPRLPSYVNITEKSGETKHVVISMKTWSGCFTGQDIFVDFVLANNSNREIWIDHRGYKDDIFMVFTRYFTGPPVPFTDFGKIHIGCEPNQDYTKNVPTHIPPHSVLTWRYKLQDYYQALEPGLYSLSAMRPFHYYTSANSTQESEDEVDVGPVYIRIFERSK